MNFIRKHWNGDFSLGVSFWCNFAAIFIACHLADGLIRRFSYSHPQALIFSVGIHAAVFLMIIYPWQVIGLLRSCRKHLATHGHVIRVRTVQAIVLISLLGTLVYLLDTIQSLVVYKYKIDNQAKGLPQPKYTLSLIEGGRYIHLNGTLDFGVTRDVERVLTRHVNVQGVVLDSSGGAVYEGRGLFKLIKNHGLDTYAFKNCSSACTIAFIGGFRRFLGPAAKLGFHQYRIDSDKIQPFLDIETEQQKDLALYKRQRVKEEFLKRIYNKPQHEIWFPSQRELLAAGVVDRIVPEDHLHTPE